MFLFFIKPVSNSVKKEKLRLRAKRGFIGHFISNLNQNRKPESLEQHLIKYVTYHTEFGMGVRKEAKSVTYYLNGPLL